MAQAHVHCISFKQTWQLLSGVNKAKCCVRNLSASLAQQNFQRITGRWTEINMALRLVQFASKNGGERRMGVELQNGGSVVDLSSADVNIPKDMRSFLEAWDTNIAAATQLVSRHMHPCNCMHVLHIQSVQILHKYLIRVIHKHVQQFHMSDIHCT